MIAKLWGGCWLFAVIILQANITDIPAINRLKREAEAAFQNKYWNVAASKYGELVEKYQVKEPEVLLNLAHAYFEAQDFAKALTHYEQAAKSNEKVIQSVAYQQAAIIKAQNGQLEEALKYLRNSLRALPDNQAARYNYEVVYALLSKQKQQSQNQSEDTADRSQQDQNKQQQQQNADRQQQQGNQGKNDAQSQSGEQDNQGAEQGKMEEKSNKSELRSKRLEQIKMTEEQARGILDAIRNNEVQYLQQLQRQPTRRADRSKPDW
ncbi:MAG: tetratricopeptide repeat protein [Cytophagales bacterium]|nr:tetratricopeptide repeat protein [Bernardetiaceae bacterium]MDW8204058.1 tetratricopeptide repeat protein [Cytophagales bacterium]